MPAKKKSGIRWGLFLAFAIVLAFISILIMKKTVLTNVARLIVGQATGFKVELDEFDVNPISGTATVKNMRLFNPPEFNSGVFLNLRELFANINIADFFKRKLIHLEQLRLNLDEITVVRSADGKTNLSALSSVENQREPARTEQERTSSEKISFLIDELHLTMRKVNYLDYSSGGPEPKRYSFDMKVNEKVLKNITNPAAIMGTIILQIAYNTAVGNLGIDFSGLEEQVQSELANTDALARHGLDYLMARKDVFEAQGRDIFSKFTESAPETSERSGIPNDALEKR